MEFCRRGPCALRAYVLDRAGVGTYCCDPLVPFILGNLFKGHLECIPLPTEGSSFLTNNNVIRRAKTTEVDLPVGKNHNGAILDVDNNLPSAFGRLDGPFLDGAKIRLFPPTKREVWVDMNSYSISSVL